MGSGVRDRDLVIVVRSMGIVGRRRRIVRRVMGVSRSLGRVSRWEKG
jgi:hypothetical protein